jgi:galactokinase
MTFDGDLLLTRVVEIPANVSFYWLLVDLAGEKSTTRILEGLQDGYPHLQGDDARQEVQRGVRELLGPTNKRIVEAAVEALQRGDAQGVGKLLLEAQAHFDQKVGVRGRLPEAVIRAVSCY